MAATLSLSGNARSRFRTPGLKTSDFFKGFFLVLWYRDQAAISPQPFDLRGHSFLKFLDLAATGSVFPPSVIRRLDLHRAEGHACRAIDDRHVVALNRRRQPFAKVLLRLSDG
jgi:hypothetical protein